MSAGPDFSDEDRKESSDRRLAELLTDPVQNAEALASEVRQYPWEQAPQVLKKLSERWAEAEEDTETQNALREITAELLFYSYARGPRKMLMKGARVSEQPRSHTDSHPPQYASEIRRATYETMDAALSRLAAEGDIAAQAWQQTSYPELRQTHGAVQALAAAALREGEIPSEELARELAARETQLAVERASAQAKKARERVADHANQDPAYVRDALTRLMELHARGRNKAFTDSMWIRVRREKQLAKLRAHLDQTGAAELFVDPRPTWQREEIPKFIKDTGLDEETLWGAVDAVEGISTPDRTPVDELWTTLRD